MKIDWKRKLSSRKLWVSIAGFVTAVLVAFNVPSMTIEQVCTIIAALGSLTAYVIGESIVDAKNKGDSDNVKI